MDENISFEQAARIVGADIAAAQARAAVREDLPDYASDYARRAASSLADTKFDFGSSRGNSY